MFQRREWPVQRPWQAEALLYTEDSFTPLLGRRYRCAENLWKIN